MKKFVFIGSILFFFSAFGESKILPKEGLSLKSKVPEASSNSIEEHHGRTKNNKDSKSTSNISPTMENKGFECIEEQGYSSLEGSVSKSANCSKVFYEINSKKK